MLEQDESIRYINNKFNQTNRTFSHHAEIVTFYRVPPRLRPHITLYVVNTGRDGSFKLSKPCHNCQRMLKRWNVKIYYST